MDTRKKIISIIIIIDDWNLFFSTCGYGYFLLQFFFRQTTSDPYIRNMCGEVKKAAAAARSNSENKLRLFGIWLWCVNHRAIYCDLIDFLCGKQLKRNSDVRTLIEKWFELWSITYYPSHFSLSMPAQLKCSHGIWFWFDRLKDFSPLTIDSSVSLCAKENSIFNWLAIICRSNHKLPPKTSVARTNMFYCIAFLAFFIRIYNIWALRYKAKYSIPSHTRIHNQMWYFVFY